MYQINDDKSIYVTRGDIVLFNVTAEDNGEAYTFKAGDLVRIKVYGKKNAENVVLQKDFPVTRDTDSVEIFLEEKDTKIGKVINKPTDYWYEVELNPLSNPQTIIGYGEDGPALFRLFPEGRDLEVDDPVITPEDIPIVDDKLDLSSKRPVENQVVTREIIHLQAAFDETKKDITEKSNATAEVANENKARIDNIVAGNDIKVSKNLDYVESLSATMRAKIDATVTSDGVHATININLREANLFYGGTTANLFIIPDECRPIDIGLIHSADGLEYRIGYNTTNKRFYLYVSVPSSVSVAPSGAGSVTIVYALGDYETKDIRIGADGKTYPSAGEAVRGQFRNITDKNLYLRGSQIYIGQTQGNCPYTDVNDFPCNSIIVNGYPISSWMANMPCPDFVGTIVTFNHSGTTDSGGVVQLAFKNTGTAMFSRIRWANWGVWKETPLGDVNIPNSKAVIPSGVHITESNKVYESFNYFPPNAIITTSTPIADGPTEEAFGTCVSFNYAVHDIAGVVQMFYSWEDKALFVRSCWGGNFTWSNWQKCLTRSDIAGLEERVEMLSRSVDSVPPLVASFLKIGCIGDSLSSGECIYTKEDGTNGYADLYEHSWGQFMARHYGIECVNFSCGGLTTKSYWEHSRGWSSAQNNLCNGYIIGLGQNDRNRFGDAFLGTIDDIDMNNCDNNADSYYGNYAKIIQKIKGVQPKAKFFILPDPIIAIDHPYNNAVVEIANKLPDCYLIDLTKYAAMYNNGGFFMANKRSGHYNSIAYNYMGKIIGEEISRYMYDNPAEFAQVEFIGTDYTAR